MKIKTIAAWPLAMAAGLLVVPMQAMAKDKDDAAVEESDSVLAADIFIPAPPPGKGQILFYRKGGLGGAAVAATAGVAEAAGTYDPQRADAVPPGLARKENEAERVKPRYQANAADVQAFYRTNRYGG